jgi:RNA polymerase sigma-70 factor (ECF subfamily)
MTPEQSVLADGPGISDGDLVRLARDGDPVAFRLLVERHQPMVRARAAALCANASDVDDIMQEAFLRAFIALDRLREPDRFAGWLAGIVLNVCRGLRRRDPVTLLPDSFELSPASAFPVQPASCNGPPSADDLDRADALREAMATLPAAQRRAVFLHYYAGLPAGQIGQAGAARVSLHKARRRLREYLTEHRPDLVPRRLMTTVRIASVEHQRRRRTHQTRSPSHLVVLTDGAGGRELPIWVLRGDGDRLERLVHTERGEASAPQAARTADDLTSRMLRAIGATVTVVDIDEIGPEVTAARIALSGPAGPRQVTARLDGGVRGRVPRPGRYSRTCRAVPPGQRGARHHGPDDRTIRVRRPRQQHHPDPGRRRLDPARDHRAGARRQRRDRARHLPGRRRPDRAAQPGTDPPRLNQMPRGPLPDTATITSSR